LKELLMTRQTSRRDFVKYAALAGTGFWVAGGSEAAQNPPGPNDRLNIAIIGAGGRGKNNLDAVARSENIVALCDVDEQRAAKAFGEHPKATRYTDFRVMLEKQKDINAVIVSTPDHTHAAASIMAMRMGKHCYCEKPLTHSVSEARLMKEIAAKHKVATQMGNQGTSSNGLREGVEVIRSGALGDVREVHVWTNRPIWKQNIDRPKETPEVPKTLSWDLWLGPAPQRPYHSFYVPFSWRGWWDFGTGALGDMACHTMNLPFMALRLGAPSSVSADVQGRVHPETAPMGCTVTYEFPAREKLPPVRLMWYERRMPPMELFHGQKPSGSGSLIIGNKGTLCSVTDNGDRNVLLPMANYQGFKPPAATLPRANGGHHREWLDACKGGRPAMSNFVDYAGQFTETVLLGNVAIRVGKRVVWDAEKLQATGLSEADRYIRREYRKGWTL
jgi:predicted dehydrogenase